jgi:outer membrane PBP1 activator LpoA protein
MKTHISHLSATLLAGLLLASAGATRAEPPLYITNADNARRAFDSGHYNQASHAYEEAAKVSAPPFAAEFLLSAAEAAQKAGDPVRAQRLMGQIPGGSLDTAQIARLQAVHNAIANATPISAAWPANAAPENAGPTPGNPQPLTPLPPPALPAAQSAIGTGVVVGGAGIALILPLSGPLASPAEAVRDGFLAAYLKSGGNAPVRLYDAGSSNESAVAAYQQALREGAGFVVGPLRKESVAAIATLGQPATPVLALNYLDETARAPFNFFQFGLAPEDEARAAAEQAVAQGDKRAIALVPQTEWGDRVLAALDKRLHEIGGGVLKSARYSNGEADFGKAIQDLLNLEASQGRHNALTAILGSKSEFEPRRRDDIDFIFIAARPAEGRMIWPQFRFYRANGLPVFATSLIYNGSGDNELNGIRFCDMPLMLQREGDWASLRSDVSDLPAIKTQPRLFALGYDAYTLASLIQAGKMQTGTVFPSASGGLMMKPDGAISRMLSCAQFRDGGIRPMDMPAPVQ